MTYKTKYKIIRKAKEAKRKARREARKNPQKRKKLKKDPGIPNLYPYKEAFMRKMKQDEEMEKEQARHDSYMGNVRKREREEAELYQEMHQDVQKRQRIHEEATIVRNRESDMPVDDNSRKNFYREFKTVVKTSEVILHVLDARDPIGTRSVSIENQIKKLDPSKKIVLVLNKIDLVPREIVENWLTYLRRHRPTIAFKASTQKQRKNIGISSQRKYEGDISGVSECLGAPGLIALLKNYARSFDIKKTITVGIIGFPNVGKSSIINSLKRSKVVGVGATPGFTKQAQTISLDSNIKLLDCPGIIFDPGLVSASDAALRNCVKFEQITDPLLPIEAIVKRCHRENLMELYKIGYYNDVKEFLNNVAQKRGKLKQKGVSDLTAAAKLVLQDWNTGKIPYYTLPPTDKHHVSAEIVEEFGQDFDINEFMEIEREMLDTLSNETYGYSTFDPIEIDMESHHYNLMEESDESPEIVVNIKKKNEPIEGKIQKIESIDKRQNKALKNMNAEKKKKEKKNDVEHHEESFNFSTDFWGNYEGEVVEEDDDMIDAFAF